MTTLVVEDRILVRIFAADFLDKAGFKVFEAGNADEPLAVLQARPDIQAVVTDVEMPGSMNGFKAGQGGSGAMAGRSGHRHLGVPASRDR